MTPTGHPERPDTARLARVLALALLGLAATAPIGCGGGEPDASSGDGGASPSTAPAADSGDARSSAPATDGPAATASASTLTLEQGYRFDHPEAWVRDDAAGSNMRSATYFLPGDGEDDDAELAVFYFGTDGAGMIQANVERWVNQMQMPDGSDPFTVADIGKRSVSSGDITHAVVTVDVSGTYVGMQFQPTPPKPDHRLAGRIIDTPAGPLYFKLVGPESTVEAWTGELDAMIESIDSIDSIEATG